MHQENISRSDARSANPKQPRPQLESTRRRRRRVHECVFSEISTQIHAHRTHSRSHKNTQRQQEHANTFELAALTKSRHRRVSHAASRPNPRTSAASKPVELDGPAEADLTRARCWSAYSREYARDEYKYVGVAFLSPSPQQIGFLAGRYNGFGAPLSDIEKCAISPIWKRINHGRNDPERITVRYN